LVPKPGALSHCGNQPGKENPCGIRSVLGPDRARAGSQRAIGIGALVALRHAWRAPNGTVAVPLAGGGYGHAWDIRTATGNEGGMPSWRNRRQA